jgi:P27 family predicted phage terminase small subunit
MGRPPKPVEKIRATQRDSKHKADGREIAVPEYELQRRVQVPVPPDELADRGLSEWEKIWLAGYWLSDEQDYHWVAVIAHAYDEITEYRAKIREDGLIQTGSMGQVIAHPLIGEIRRAESAIMKALSMIGFSPTDRARLGLAEVKRQQGLAELADRYK